MSISEKAMTEDLSGSLLCQEEEKLRSLIEEWHTFVSQSAASNEDLVWQIILLCIWIEIYKTKFNFILLYWTTMVLLQN